jgi:hypothetical protein
MPECHCVAGWICEEHPDMPHEHEGCDGAGKPCENPACPWWKGPKPAALNTDDWKDRQPDGTLGVRKKPN